MGREGWLGRVARDGEGGVAKEGGYGGRGRNGRHQVWAHRHVLVHNYTSLEIVMYYYLRYMGFIIRKVNNTHNHTQNTHSQKGSTIPFARKGIHVHVHYCLFENKNGECESLHFSPLPTSPPPPPPLLAPSWMFLAPGYFWILCLGMLLMP